MAETDTGFVFGAKFSDDISSSTKPAVSSVRELAQNVKFLGDAFKQTNTANQSMTIGLGQARDLFRTAGQSSAVMRAALKDLGTSALDTKLIMSALTKEMTAGRKEALGFGEALSKAKDGGHGLVTTLGDALGVARELAHVLIKPFEALWEFGSKAQEAFGERINTLRAYNALLGDSKKAQEEFQWAHGFAMTSSFKSSQVEDVQKRMIGSGMSTEQARAATAGIVDIATLKGAGAEGQKAMQAGSGMFAEIGEQGLSTRHLRALSQDFGISMTRIENELAKIVGEKNPENIGKRIKKGEWSGEAGGRVGQLAVLNMIKGLVGENKLGEFAAGGAQTTEVALVNQAEQWKNLMKTFDSEVLPGVKAYKEALHEQGLLFNANTNKGQKMSEMLQDMASASSDMKASWENFSTGFIESFAATWDQTAEEAGQGAAGVKSMGDRMKDFGSILGEIAGPTRDVISFFRELSPVMTVLGTTLNLLFQSLKVGITTVVAYTSALVDSALHPTHARDNFRVAGEIVGEAAGIAAHSIRVSAGVEARTQLPGGAAPNATKAQGTTATFGGGKGKHGKGGKGGGSGAAGAFGDFSGEGWDISGGGSWGGAGSSWGTSVAEADAYPGQAQRQVGAGVSAQSAAPIAKEVRVEIFIDGAGKDAQQITDILVDVLPDVLRGIGRHGKNPSQLRI